MLCSYFASFCIPIEKNWPLSRKTVQSKLLTKGAFTLLLSQEHSFTVAYKHIINNSFELAPHWRRRSWFHTESIGGVRKKNVQREIQKKDFWHYFQNKKKKLPIHLPKKSGGPQTSVPPLKSIVSYHFFSLLKSPTSKRLQMCMRLGSFIAHQFLK